ncbi:MAG: ComEC/Rec2 family competence protein [Ferruginibacter sp.]
MQIRIPIWKSSPFIRLLIPLIAGILLQWYLQFLLPFILLSFTSFLLAFLVFSLLPLSLKYKMQWLQGFAINLLLFAFGLFITWQKDIRNHNNWFGNYYQGNNYIIVKIDEPLIEKEKSYKANGIIESLINSDSSINCTGKILLYFSKDSITQQLQYGDEILIHKPLQQITNSSDFDYAQYEAFQQTYHSVYLKNKNWILLKGSDINLPDAFIYKTKTHILSVIQNNIRNDNYEQAVAEALLIGYRNDIDKDLAQAYSNAGVVYLISISGMSLGLLYVLLMWIFSKLPFIRRSNWLQLILIICCLWLFALLTGGSASALRSVVLFTFIAIGKTFNKKASMYNLLAASAFMLCCYDPYLLWNIGFQISYLAITSILIFRKPIYDLIYIKNKWLDRIWQMASVTLSVQVLIFPICIYYFHQFSTLFLVANLIAIPLSTIILISELLLIVFSGISYFNIYIGKLVFYLIAFMNKFILWINKLPLAVINNLSISMITLWLLYSVIITLSAYLIYKNKSVFKFSLFITLLIAILRMIFLF